MTPILWIFVYAVYALTQGILVNRFLVKDETAPVLMVMVTAAMAPLVTVFLIFGAVYEAIKWAALPKQ